MKRRFLIFPLIFFAVLTTGCSNYRELESMAIVAGMAIDKGENGYQITFETLDTSASTGKGASIEPVIIESDGTTIFDAIRNALKKTDKKLYFGDCKVMIISEELARQGIAPVLDLMVRDPEPRLTIVLYIAKDKQAKEIIEQKSPSNPITSFALGTMAENHAEHLSKTVFVKLYEATNLLGGEGISLVLPALGTEKNQDDETVSADGTAVFKKDRLVGYISSDESKYLALIKNEVSGGLLITKMESVDLSLEILDSITKVKPILTGESPEIKIDVKTHVIWNETMGSGGKITQDEIKKVENKAAETIETNVRQLIKKVQQEYGSDIFGFGSAINKDDPAYWKKIKPQWDELFKSLKVDVSAKVTVINTSHTKSKIKVGG